jgi:predicted dehydrogenase
MPAHNYIYDPTIQRAKRLIEAGDLGRLCMTWIVYAIHHSEELAAHYPGILRQVIPHHLYTLLYLQGIPRRVSAMTAQLHYERLDREDQAALELEMEDGSMAHLFATFAADDDTSDPWSFMVKVLGTHGAVVHSWRNAITSRVVGTHARAYISYEESFANEDEYFLTRTLRGEAPLSTLRDARLVQSIVDAAAESARLAAAVDLSLE